MKNICNFYKSINSVGSNLIILEKSSGMSVDTLLTIKKYQKALKGFAELHNTAKPKERHRFVYPLRISGISLSHLKKLGFKITHWQWVKCLDRSERNKGEDYC